jgi:hypothetical protein
MVQFFIFYVLFIGNSKRVYNTAKYNHKEDKNEFLIEMNKLKSQKQNGSFSSIFKSGLDERYTNEGVDVDVVHKIEKNILQLELLKKLENPKIAILTKKSIIEEYHYLFEEKKIAPDLSAGGLYNEFF